MSTRISRPQNRPWGRRLAQVAALALSVWFVAAESAQAQCSGGSGGAGSAGGAMAGGGGMGGGGRMGRGGRGGGGGGGGQGGGSGAVEMAQFAVQMQQAHQQQLLARMAQVRQQQLAQVKQQQPPVALRNADGRTTVEEKARARREQRKQLLAARRNVASR